MSNGSDKYVLHQQNSDCSCSCSLHFGGCWIECAAVHLRYCHFKLSIEYSQAPAENNSNKGCAALTALQCTYASDSTALASAPSLYFFSNFIKVKPRSPVALGIWTLPTIALFLQRLEASFYSFTYWDPLSLHLNGHKANNSIQLVFICLGTQFLFKEKESLWTILDVRTLTILVKVDE